MRRERPCREGRGEWGGERSDEWGVVVSEWASGEVRRQMV